MPQNQDQDMGKNVTQSSKPSSSSVSQADGTAADSPKGETRAQGKQASGTGQTGQHPEMAGSKQPRVKSETAENRDGKINPSSPTDATEGGETASSHRGMPANPTMDSAGEVGEPSGKGNLDVKPDTLGGQKKDSRERKKIA